MVDCQNQDNPLKNQNQRYEARVGFPGYEARVGFPAPYQGDFKRKCVSSVEDLPHIFLKPVKIDQEPARNEVEGRPGGDK